MKSRQGIYSRMLEFARPYAGHLIVAIASLAAARALEARAMFMITHVVDQGFLNTDKIVGKALLLKLPLVIVGLIVGKGAFNYVADILNNSVSNKIAMDVRRKLFDKLISLELGYHSHQRIGTLGSRLTYDAANMQSGISDVVGRVIGSILGILFLSATVLYLNWRLALQTAVVFPVAIGPLYYFGRKIRSYAARDQERMADMSSMAQEALSGIRVVQAFTQEERERKRFAEAAYDYYHAIIKKLRYAALSSPVMETIGGVGVALMIYLAGNLVVDGQMTIGELLALIAAVGAMYPHIKSLNGVNVSINNAIAAGERVFEVLDTRAVIEDPPGARELVAPMKGIRFEKVGFHYTAEQAVLKGLSFEVKAGQRVALVGPSGAGKTTLVDLVPRFHDPTEGAVLWDGFDLREARIKSLRGLIGVVTQETFLFNDSISANIAYGRPGATPDEVIAAAKAANAHEFISAQPQGYDTLIGERGVRLSGGQRQRLSIARAIIKNPPVLILDEATASLDTESERAVQDALDRLMKARTTLVIAHRLSTVRHADEILVLDKGRIVERGKHALLLKKGGLYSRLYKLQFGKKSSAAK